MNFELYSHLAQLRQLLHEDTIFLCPFQNAVLGNNSIPAESEVKMLGGHLHGPVMCDLCVDHLRGQFFVRDNSSK